MVLLKTAKSSRHYNRSGGDGYGNRQGGYGGESTLPWRIVSGCGHREKKYGDGAAKGKCWSLI